MEDTISQSKIQSKDNNDKKYIVPLENIYINNIAYSDYINSFLKELNSRSDLIDIARINKLKILIEKLVDPQFLQTLITQMNSILEDNKITSNDIPAIMIIIINLLNVQIPKMKTIKFTPQDLKEVILIIFDSLLDHNLNKLNISELEKLTLNKLISNCFDLVLIKLDNNGLFTKISNWLSNILSFKSCKCT